MTNITTALFNELLEEQTTNISKWVDLPQNKIFTVKDARMIDTEFGEALVLKLSDDTELWAPGHMIKKMRPDVFPFHFRSLGLKQCKKDKKNRYHSFDIVYPRC